MTAHPPWPLRVLSPAQFAEMHTAHTLAHPPDGVLFQGDHYVQRGTTTSEHLLCFAHSTAPLAIPWSRLGGRGRRPRAPPPVSDLLLSASSSDEEDDDNDDNDELDP
ncbi:hypothetical protein C8J57DRAFT_1519150 [Mycena rebaudengoi]|nr:hypothetical protein C8J57DRAFT_1519150 [Mycena rebaudengoi]